MLTILYAGCLGLSPAISPQFTVEMCSAAKNCEKNSPKTLFWDSKSFKVIDVDKPKKPVTSACYSLQQVCIPICNRFYIITANNGKITSFGGGTPFDAFV